MNAVGFEQVNERFHAVEDGSFLAGELPEKLCLLAGELPDLFGGKIQFIVFGNGLDVFEVGIAEVFVPVNLFWDVNAVLLQRLVEGLVMQKLRVGNDSVEVENHGLEHFLFSPHSGAC